MHACMYVWTGDETFVPTWAVHRLEQKPGASHVKSHDGVQCNFTLKDWSVVGVGSMQRRENGCPMKKTDELVWVQKQNPNKATKKKFRSLTWKDDAKQQTAAKRRSIADRTPAVAGSSQDANAGSSKDAVVGEIIDI